MEHRPFVLLTACALLGCGSEQPVAPVVDASSEAAVVPDADGSSGADASPDVSTLEGGPRVDAGACTACTSYVSMGTVGTIAQAAITELSGLAASHLHADVYYGHNDSGDSPRFFSIGATGAALGEFRVSGASAVDWEDISVGPCPSGSCVYLADIGDNAVARTEYQIYRVPEPSSPMTQTPATVAGEKIRFVYPDGPHNSEALAVHPVTGDVYLITKVDAAPSKVYRLMAPLNASVVLTAALLGTITIPSGSKLVTGADIHPCGDRLLLRTYSNAWELVAPAGDFGMVPVASPQLVPTVFEVQGEAIAYPRDGRGYLTASEGTSQPLHIFVCQ
jgi:hypothetical protein